MVQSNVLAERSFLKISSVVWNMLLMLKMSLAQLRRATKFAELILQHTIFQTLEIQVVWVCSLALDQTLFCNSFCVRFVLMTHDVNAFDTGMRTSASC